MTGEELRTRRLRLNLSQSGLAKELGVRSNTVARWEREELPLPAFLHLAVEALENRHLAFKKGKPK